MDVYLTTIDELISSGQLKLVQSQEIRNAIGLLRKEYEVATRSQQDIITATLRLVPDMYNLIKLDAMGVTILNPLADLNGDGLILRNYRTIRDMQNRFHNYNIRMSNYIKEYKDMVLDELEKVQ